MRDFDKIARRKKKSALFLVWHSHDKEEMARNKSDELDLRTPVYHGKAIKWDDKFGKVMWRHVLIMKADGEIAYMGKPDRKFEAALKELTE